MAWIILLLSAVLEAVWATALGAADGFTKPLPTLVFVIANAASLIGLGRAMKTIPVGTAYAVWTSVGSALTVGYAMATGDEPASIMKAIFLGAIIACVVGLKMLGHSDSAPTTQQSPIVVSGVVFRNDAGDVFTVRKRGTDRFMLVGGKPEAGEDATQCAVREVFEETGLHISASDLKLLGQFDAPAANEPGRRIHSTVFLCPGYTPTSGAAEIAEVRWSDIHQDLDDIAPLLSSFVFHILRGDGETDNVK